MKHGVCDKILLLNINYHYKYEVEPIMIVSDSD